MIQKESTSGLYIHDNCLFKLYSDAIDIDRKIEVYLLKKCKYMNRKAGRFTHSNSDKSKYVIGKGTIFAVTKDSFNKNFNRAGQQTIDEFCDNVFNKL